ncbi:ATP-binding protein, partial [Bacteroidales bacterium OttesenSCG-928-K22]|nr:ATP-binding protein [Bacteroidales bacterium OttesenSCG-928-K22]
MSELLKLLISKDFVSNAKDIIALMRRSKDWKKDIVKYNGLFYHQDKIESSVLIEESVKIAGSKGWSDEEQREAKFILTELFDNSFSHGLPSKEHSFINADIVISSTFLKLTLSDFGVTFDLIEELRNQEAFNPDSDKHKGLSFITKITPEIYQEKYANKNTIIVIKRQGLKPLRIRKQNDILVFEVSNSTYVNDNNLGVFVDKINALTSDSKIIIDFGSTRNMMITKMYREIRHTLQKVEQTANIKIAVCGLEEVPIAIRDYFSSRFPTFETFE